VTLQVLTKSRLYAWRKCKRLHRLKYLDGWRTARMTEPMFFGTLFHAGAEEWWKTGDIGMALEAAVGAATANADPVVLAKALEAIRLYPLAWPDREDYEVLAIERGATWPLINPDTMYHSRTYEMGGVLDLLLRRRSTGQVILVEHKSTSEDISDDAANYWKRLAMDSQLSIYVVGAESMGHQPERIIYDVVVRPQISLKLATPVEKRKFKKDGTLYANQRDTDETLAEYTARLRADMEARPERYHGRREIARLESEIRDGMLDVWQEAKAMRAAELSGRHPRNPDACHQYGTCEFWDVCANGVDPELSTEYVSLEDVNPELTRKLTKAPAAVNPGVPVAGAAVPALEVTK